MPDASILPDVEVTDLPDGVRIVLPQRNLGAFRFLDFSILFGLGFSGFAVFWMVMASQSMFNSAGQFDWFGLPFTLFGLPFVTRRIHAHRRRVGHPDRPQ